MLGILFSLFTICFLASSVDVFLYFFPLLFAKYIMTLYLPWPRALRPLCGFTILAISQINHRSLCRNITVYMKTALFSWWRKQVYTGQLDCYICRYVYRIYTLISFFLISTQQFSLKQRVTEGFSTCSGGIYIL